MRLFRRRSKRRRSRQRTREVPTYRSYREDRTQTSLRRLRQHYYTDRRPTESRVTAQRIHTTRSAPRILPSGRVIRGAPVVRPRTTRTGSQTEPYILKLAPSARRRSFVNDPCAQKARRRAVLMAKSGGKGIRAPGPYKRHTEACR